MILESGSSVELPERFYQWCIIVNVPLHVLPHDITQRNFVREKYMRLLM